MYGHPHIKYKYIYIYLSVYLFQMLHVWSIYEHLRKNDPNVGKYSIHGASGYI